MLHADFIVDFTQVTALGAGVFNVVLVRNPYATVYAGDITAVRARCTFLPLPRHTELLVLLRLSQLHGSGLITCSMKYGRANGWKPFLPAACMGMLRPLIPQEVVDACSTERHVFAAVTLKRWCMACSWRRSAMQRVSLYTGLPNAPSPTSI